MSATNHGDGDEGAMGAIHARLSTFVSEHKAALANGDPRALRASDRRLAAWAEQALAQQAQAELARAELERLKFNLAGGRPQ